MAKKKGKKKAVKKVAKKTTKKSTKKGAKKTAKKKVAAKKMAGVFECKLTGTSGAIQVVANSAQAARAQVRKLLKLKRLPKTVTIRRVSALPKGCRLVCK